MATQDHERYQSLHTIGMLKEVIRKWWGLELAFADREGYVLDHASGKIIPPNNDFCRLSLFSKEGFRRCNQSVKFVGDRFRGARAPRRSFFHECHLDLSVVGCPIVLGGTYEGFLFVGGFLRESPSEKVTEKLKERIRVLNPGSTDLDRAATRIPILQDREVENLCDLLEFGVDEIAAYEAALARHDDALAKLSEELTDKYRFDSIIGRGPAMQAVFDLLEKVCHSDATVLIQGESGTGKELVARALHYNGNRKDRPFVVQNCSAFNDNLLESALFGHTKGAFTGAVRDKKGLFEVADGGSFFLDEVGDMSPALQVKLLRVLQEGTFTPVGDTQTREVDVRVIAATHKDLTRAVAEGEFREDLFYRINVIRLDLPALRQRPEDIPLLCSHFLGKHAREGFNPDLADESLQQLVAYAWPGNVRELENEIERLLVLGAGHEVLEPGLLSPRIRDGAPKRGGEWSGIKVSGSLKSAVEALEREMIHEGLVRTHWNKSKLARDLGISRSNLIAKCEKYGFEKPGQGHPA